MDRKKAERALINAHKAGDTEAAKKIANYLKNSPEDSYAKETLSNVPSSAANVVKDTASALMNPIDTMKGLVRAGAGGVGKLTNKLDFSDSSSPVLRNISAFNNSPNPYEPYADSVADHYSGRYGSVDKAKETFKTDPVGVALEAPLGLLGVMGAAKSVGKNASRLVPESSPHSLYGSAAKFSPTLPKKKRDKLINTGLEQGLAPTSKGVEKLNDRIFEFNDQISRIINESTSSGNLIPRQALYKYLDQARENLGGVKIDAASDMKEAKKYLKMFDDDMKRQNKDYFTPAEVQAFKINAYKKIKFDSKQLKASEARDEIRRATARGAKDALEDVNPKIKELNRQEGDLLELQPHLMRAAGINENRDILGLGPVFKMGAGAAFNEPLIGAGAALLDLPKVKSNLAINLHKSKNKDRKQLIDNPVVQGLLIEQSLREGDRLRDEYINGLLGSPK